MLFKTILLLAMSVLAQSSLAEDKLSTSHSFPLETQITYGTLDRSLELVLNEHGNELSTKTQIQNLSSYEVYMDAVIVRFERIDEERLRVYLPAALNFLLVPKKNITDYFEKIFKSFVIQTDVSLANTLAKLDGDKYVATSPEALQEMRNFIELVKQQGTDAAIKRFASSSYAPPIQQIYQIGFFVDVLQIGRPEGVHVGHFHLFANNATLPTHRFNSPGYTSEHRHLQLSDVYHVFDKNDPLLTEYLEVMNQLRERIVVLEKRGWLEGLWKSHAKETDIIEAEDNVVPLSPFGACLKIF